MTARAPLARPPFRYEPLAFGDLLRCHYAQNDVQIFGRMFIALVYRKLEPLVGFGIVLRDTEAQYVYLPERHRSNGISLISCQPVPADSLGMALRDTLALLVHEPEKGLSTGIPLISRQPEPADSLGMALRNTLALEID